MISHVPTIVREKKQNKSLRTTLEVFLEKADGYKVYADLVECHGGSERWLCLSGSNTLGHNAEKPPARPTAEQRVTVTKRETEAPLLKRDTATGTSRVLDWI